MRIVLFTLLIVAAFAALSTKEENKQIKFNLDLFENSPVGLSLSGSIDPKEDTNNKIQAFIKLANQYIPILESLGNRDSELKYERKWHYSFAGISVDVYWYFQLIVGWTVKPGSKSDNFYEVTYAPFIWGGTYGRVNGTTWPVVGTTGTGLQYVHAYAPIGVTLYREGKVCFGGTYTVLPVALRTDVFVALNQCMAEIVDEIVDQQPIHLDCNFTAPQNFTLFNVNFTNTYTGDLIPEICFSF